MPLQLVDGGIGEEKSTLSSSKSSLDSSAAGSVRHKKSPTHRDSVVGLYCIAFYAKAMEFEASIWQKAPTRSRTLSMSSPCSRNR